MTGGMYKMDSVKMLNSFDIVVTLERFNRAKFRVWLAVQLISLAGYVGGFKHAKIGLESVKP